MFYLPDVGWCVVFQWWKWLLLRSWKFAGSKFLGKSVLQLHLILSIRSNTDQLLRAGRWACQPHLLYMVKVRRSLDDVQIQSSLCDAAVSVNHSRNASSCPCLCRMGSHGRLAKLMMTFQRSTCSYTSSMWSGSGSESCLNFCPMPSGATGVRSTAGRLKWARFPPHQVTHTRPTPVTLSCVWRETFLCCETVTLTRRCFLFRCAWDSGAGLVFVCRWTHAGRNHSGCRDDLCRSHQVQQKKRVSNIRIIIIITIIIMTFTVIMMTINMLIMIAMNIITITT